MTKTFKQLIEATGDIVKNIIGPAELRELKTLAKQLSSAFQPDIPQTLQKIEDKLNFFGYTLGELDLDIPFEDSDSEDYFVLTNVDQEIVKNVYITVSWDTLASGQQVAERPDGAKLEASVKVDVNEVSPEELQDMIDASLTDGEEYIVQDEDSEDEQNLDEAFRIKKVSRWLSIFDADDNHLLFTVNADGSIEILTENTVKIQKIKAAEVIQAIQDHFVKYTE